MRNEAPEGQESNYYHRVTDVTPYEYSHGIYQDRESRYPAYERALVRDIDHSQHRRLDHRYDDRHDIEPVPFHEHAVLPAVDRPESRSYLHHAHVYADGMEPHYKPVYSSAGKAHVYEPVHSVHHYYDNKGESEQAFLQ